MSSGTGSQLARGELSSGAFHARFRDERTARAAGRDATAAGFTVDIREQDAAEWFIVCRRRQPFPADETHRYASRLRTIATANSGTYERFVAA